MHYIDFTLENIEGLAYILDKEGHIVNVNKEFYHYLGLSDVIGKKFQDLNLMDGYLIDEKNINLIKQDIKYDKSYEIYKLNDHYKSQIFTSSKRLIYVKGAHHVKDIYGLFNHSTPIDREGQYSPQNVFNISNTQMGLKIKENMNALYAFKKHLEMLGSNVAETTSLKAMSRILEKMRITMDGIILSNDVYNNAHDVLEPFRNLCLCIGSVSEVRSQQLFNIIQKSLSEIDYQIHQNIQLGIYAVIIVERSSYDRANEELKSALSYAFTTNSLVILTDYLDDVSRNKFVSCSEHALTEMDTLIYPLWKSHLLRLIQKNVKETNELRILSIEDDVDSQDALCMMLNSYSIVNLNTCFNAREALLQVQKQPYDLIILDINLGDLSGFKLAKSIREIQIKKGFMQSLIYVNTGYDYSEKFNCLLVGIDKIYLKPYLIIDLDNIMNQFTL